VEYLLKAFGGTGSLNDVALPDPARNAEFRKLREKMHEVATMMRRARDRREAT
jgi:hypothetical protein